MEHLSKMELLFTILSGSLAGGILAHLLNFVIVAIHTKQLLKRNIELDSLYQQAQEDLKTLKDNLVYLDLNLDLKTRTKKQQDVITDSRLKINRIIKFFNHD